jgi:tetratricopeptide (TPR) repeat protein
LSIDVSTTPPAITDRHVETGSRVLSVTTLGTCRLAEPMAAAAKLHPMVRNLTNWYGFVHTTKEILQMLDVFEGRELPEHLRRFICSSEYRSFQPREGAAENLYFVEVSSQKEIHYREWLLQINCFSDVFEKRRELFTTFFKFKYAHERDKRAEALEQLPSFAGVDPVERSILLEGYMHVMTRDELKQDLQTIADRIPGPTVFVTHIDVTDNNGKVIETRSRLCNWMREICAEQGYTLFDPTPQVLAYDRVRALAEEGRDNNHYTTEFKSVLGSLLFETYGQPLLEAMSTPGIGAALEMPAAAPALVAPAKSAPVAEAPVALAPAAPVQEAAPPAPQSEPAPEELRPLLTEARARIGRGEMDEAEVMLRGAAIDHPGVAEIYALLANVAYHRGDSTGALADLRHALRIDPSLIEPKVMLVRIAQRLNRLEEACAQALELVTVARNDYKALTVAAKALVKAKRFHEASPVWRRVAELRQDDAAPLAEAARCELKSRSYDEAVKTAEAALLRDPEDAAALHIQVEALQRMKRMKEMAAVVLRIAVIDPVAAMATVPALIAASHHEDAAAVIAAVRAQGHAAAEDPVLQAGLVRSLIKRARLAVERHDDGAAASAWMAVLLVDPTNKNANSGMRKLVAPLVTELRKSLAEGDVASAMATCRRGLSWDPANGRLLKEYATLLEREENWADAAKAWEGVAEANGLETKTLMRAAKAASRAGRPDEALRIYSRLEPAVLAELSSAVHSLTRKLVKVMRTDFAEGRLDDAVVKARHVQMVDPEGEAAPRLLRKALATYRRQLKEAVAAGDLHLQEDLARRVLAIDPQRPDALKVLVKLYRGARRWREAIEVLQQLVRLEPDMPIHWRRLASACRSARNYDIGVTAALRAVELEPNNAQSLEFLSDILNRQALAA